MELVDRTGGHKLVLQGTQPVCPVGWRWAVFTPGVRECRLRGSPGSGVA